MILACGIPSESPVALAVAAARRAGIACVVLNQRQIAAWSISVDGAGGTLRGPDGCWSLDAFTGVYVRLVDPSTLPEVAAASPGTQRDRLLRRATALHDVVSAWLEIAPCRVANRSRPGASNTSKPYQAQRIAACGFEVPPTLVTNDPRDVQAFVREHGRVVYKSTSGVRSIVRELRPSDAARLGRIRTLPTQFQALVAGTDVRVHVVGDAVFATEIRSDATDYRYAGREGRDAALAACAVPPDVADRCRALARALGLPLCGIDLRRTPQGAWCCFEVNPSPAYSYYQQHTGQPIADALVDHLATPGGEHGAGDRELGRPERDLASGAPASR